MHCSLFDAVVSRESCVSDGVKECRVDSAACWVGSERREGSMEAGEEVEGGRRGVFLCGGRRRDSHVWCSVWRLWGLAVSYFLFKGKGEGWGGMHTERFVARGLVFWPGWIRSWDSVVVLRGVVLIRSLRELATLILWMGFN